MHIEELPAVPIQVQYDTGTPVLFIRFFQREFGAAVAFPVYGHCLLPETLENVDTVADHERVVESKAKMTDNIIPSFWPLYFSRNSSAPLKATWLMYLFPSAVSPTPRSVDAMVLFSWSMAMSDP